MKEIDSSELSASDGKEGKPVYIAHQGRVFDVSESKLWKGGLHMKRHHAGPISPRISAGPHGSEVLERYPQVAVVKIQEAVESAIPEMPARLLAAVPHTRRHPRSDDQSISRSCLCFATTLFSGLYLVTGVRVVRDPPPYTVSGAGDPFHARCGHGAGYYTWWLNYMAKPVTPVKIKIIVSVILLSHGDRASSGG